MTKPKQPALAKAKVPKKIGRPKGLSVPKPANAWSFPNGNRFWEMRSRHGRNPTFTDPEKLREACLDYFEWNAANPLYADTLVTFQGSAIHEPVAKMRAMTIMALCLFIDVPVSSWKEWREGRDDLKPVIRWAEGVIYAQKFEGASADMLNAAIIAKELGLAEKTDVALSGPNGGPIRTSFDVSRLSTAALQEIIMAMRDENPDADES